MKRKDSFINYLVFGFFFETISYSTGWPEIHYVVDEDGLKLMMLTLSPPEC